MTQSAVYDELVEHLNSMPIGAPKTPELIEILETIFTEEEQKPVLPMEELVMKVMGDKKREFKF